MAYIFLSFSGSGSQVKPFEDSLTRQGHKVYSDDDFGYSADAVLEKLAEFDAIIVIWSENSVGQERTLKLAMEAIRLGRLIQTVAPGFRPDQIPAAFRAHPALPVSATGAIAQAIASLGVAPGTKSLPPKRLRRTEGVGSSGASPYRVEAEPVEIASKRRVLGSLSLEQPAQAGAASTAQALAVESGRLVHKIPEKMWVGEAETVEVRLGRKDAQNLAVGLIGRGALSTSDIPIVETMSISLYSSPGAFEIARQSETTQLVMSDALQGTQFVSEDFGRWTWEVTPKKAGAHQLFVKVSAGLKDSRGVPTTARLPDQEFKVSVSVNAGKATLSFVKRTVPTLVLAGAGGLVAAFTRDVWWPKLHEALKSLGWLN